MSEIPAPSARRWPRWLVGALLVAIVAVVLLLSWQALQPRITEETVDEAVVTTLVREAEQSFYVTGTLDFATTVERTSRKTLYLLPGLFELDMGDTRATVRVPGRVAYGFDVQRLSADDIHYREEGLVEVALPPLAIFSVEPDLERLEYQTEVGWARTYRGSGREVEQGALRRVPATMRAQAERHLGDSFQPRINSAVAVARLLTPALEAAGLEAPRFRFVLDSGARIELDQDQLARAAESGPAPLDLTPAPR